MIFIFGYLLLNFFVIYTDCPVWNYDGSSTYQADGSNSDIYLHPVALYKDPFLRDQNNVLVLCDTYNHERIPTGHYILKRGKKGFITLEAANKESTPTVRSVL